MPKVISYRNSEMSGGLSPSRVGVDMDAKSQAAVVQSGLPDKTGIDLMKAGASAVQAAGKRSAEIMKDAASLNETAKTDIAKIQMMAAKSEALGMESAAQIITAAGVRFQKMQEDYDAAEVMNASNEWHEYVNKYWSDSKNGVEASRQMGNAKGVYDETGMYLNELSSRISGWLRTEAQKQAFAKSIAGSRLSVEERASRFEASELDKFTKVSTKTTIESSINAVINDPSQTSFNANFSRARDALLYSMRAMDEETQQFAVDELKSDFQSSITASLIEKDPLKAEAYLKMVNSDILPEKRIELKSAVQKAVLPIKAQKLYTEVGGDYASGMQWISDNVSAVEQKEMSSAFKGYWADQNSIKQATYEETDTELTDMYLKNGNLNGVNLDNLVDSEKLDAKRALYWKKTIEADRERAIAKSENAREKAERAALGKIYTDRRTIEDIWSRIDNNTLAADYPTFGAFKAKYGEKLSLTDLKMFRSMYDKTGGGTRANAVKMDESAVLRRMLKNAGISDEEAIGKAFDRYNYEYSEAEKKAPMSSTLAIKIMQGVIAPQVVGKTKNWIGMKSDKTVPRFMIPTDAEQRDGLWYVPDENGKWRRFIPDKD